MDLIRHGENGWLADVEDATSLARHAGHVLIAGAPAAVLDAARRTAEANAYDAQTPLWERLFDGFVERQHT
jgi:hypothetical protein